MKSSYQTPYKIKSISELHRLFGIQKPDHPLISVIDVAAISYEHSDIWKHFTHDLYCVSIKHGSNGIFKYGQQNYDFEEGLMGFTQPGQVFSVTQTTNQKVDGFLLVFKPELIRNYSLGKTIQHYGFFQYSLAEALHLSEKEDQIMCNLLQQMQQELKTNIDDYSQDVIVSHIELLLNYANRFYHRQFITRKAINHDVLAKLDEYLNQFYSINEAKGLPQVQIICQELNLSQNYLSDLLKSITGLNTQQYLQQFVIDKAKNLLSTTTLSVSEIAYELGFEYTQSFSKLFKKITQQTPIAYRNSLN